MGGVSQFKNQFDMETYKTPVQLAKEANDAASEVRKLKIELMAEMVALRKEMSSLKETLSKK